VLQGESMLNDATALLIYRAAVLAAAGSFSLVADAPILVLAAVGGLVAGYAPNPCRPAGMGASRGRGNSADAATAARKPNS
jgi:hypothetical protein